MLAVLHVDFDLGDDGNDGSADSPFQTIQQAIHVAAANPGDDIVKIAPGTYAENLQIDDSSGALVLRSSTENPEDVTIVGLVNNTYAVQITSVSTVTLDGLTVTNNAPGTSSGGINSSGTLHVIHTQVFQTQGKGINATGTVHIEDSIIRENDAEGVYIAPGSQLDVRRSTVADNRGSGMVLFGSNTVAMVEQSTISGNQASIGGGVWARSAEITFVNNTISGNTASQQGGGIYVTGGSLSLVNTTITENDAGTGGGVYAVEGGAAPDVSSLNTLVAGNSASSSPDFHGAATSLGHNLIGVGDGSAGFGQSGDIVGTGAQPIDPRLGELQDNGGPTYTHALLADSPALDAGSDDGAPAVDQRGVSRPQGSHVDIGAFELEPETDPDPDPDTDPDPDPDPDPEINVPPTLTSVSYLTTLDNAPVVLTGTFADPNSDDAHRLEIDWGDGGSVQIIDLSPGSREFDVTWQYATPGIYEVSVTVVDSPGESNSDAITILAPGVQVVGGTLYIIGSTGSDQVFVDQHPRRGVTVEANFLAAGQVSLSPSGVDRIFAAMGSGDDYLNVGNRVALPAILHGGEGDNELRAGGGRSLLIGGYGRDRLFGSKEDSVLIGGHVRLDKQLLNSVLSAWNTSQSHDVRSAAVISLLAGEIIDDEEQNELTGNGGQNLFFAGQNDLLRDVKLRGRWVDTIVRI